MKAIASIIATMLLVSTAAAGTIKVKIPMHGEQFKGQNTIRLKQEIKRVNPDLNLRRADLVEVKLVAKSKKGRGTVYLTEGDYVSRTKQVYGTPDMFHAGGGYERIFLMAPRQEQGAWQLHLRGNIKVRRIVATLEVRNHRPKVTRSCTYVLETIWGQDLQRYTKEASGVKGSGVKAQACSAARSACEAVANEVPLLQCTRA
jgi:hypothetical protein